MDKNNRAHGKGLAPWDDEKRDLRSPRSETMPLPLNQHLRVAIPADYQDPLFRYGAPILLLVGGPYSPSAELEPEGIYAPEHLLTQSSPFFRAALKTYQPTVYPGSTPDQSASFLEAHTRIIIMPEDRPPDVRYFVQCIYTALVSVPSDHKRAENSDGTWAKQSTCLFDTGTIDRFLTPSLRTAVNNAKARRMIRCKKPRHAQNKRPDPPCFGPLIRLYLFAEKYLVDDETDSKESYLGLKDVMVEAVHYVASETRSLPNRYDVDLLFANVAILSPAWEYTGMRKLLVDFYVGMRNASVILCRPPSPRKPRTIFKTGASSTSRHGDAADSDSSSDFPFSDPELWNPHFLQNLAIAACAETQHVTILLRAGLGPPRDRLMNEEALALPIGPVSTTSQSDEDAASLSSGPLEQRSKRQSEGGLLVWEWLKTLDVEPESETVAVAPSAPAAVPADAAASIATPSGAAPGTVVLPSRPAPLPEVDCAAEESSQKYAKEICIGSLTRRRCDYHHHMWP